MISSIFPVTMNNIARTKQICEVSAWLQGWCQGKKFVFVDHGMIYSTPGPKWDTPISDGENISSTGSSGAC